MEVQRFDALARQLGQGGSRRRLLGLFGGTALGGLMVTAFAPEAEAKKKKKKKSCKKKKCGECQVCQQGKCKPKPDDTPCDDGACQGGVCIDGGNCPPDQVCELSDVCCPEPVTTFEGAEVCAPIDALCGCPNGTEPCIIEGGGMHGDCCQAGEFCDQNFGWCGQLEHG